MDKKFQIFVSSTFRDLVDERQAAIRSILDVGHIPAGMELFPATDDEQLSYIKRVIDECDYYVLIMGARYGSLDAGGISYTEREYDHAKASGKTVLAFPHSHPDKLAFDKNEPGAKGRKQLTDFRRKVMTGRIVKSWTTLPELQVALVTSLINAFAKFPQTGWVRADTRPNVEVIEESNRLLTENAELKKQIDTLAAPINAQIDGLASLDSFISVTYYSGRRQATNSRMSARLTWRQIAVGFAGAVETASPSEIVDAAISFTLAQANAGWDERIVRVAMVDAHKIRAQMIALGIVIIQTGRNASGGYTESLSLTPLGREIYLGEMVTR